MLTGTILIFGSFCEKHEREAQETYDALSADLLERLKRRWSIAPENVTILPPIATQFRLPTMDGKSIGQGTGENILVMADNVVPGNCDCNMSAAAEMAEVIRECCEASFTCGRCHPDLASRVLCKVYFSNGIATQSSSPATVLVPE